MAAIDPPEYRAGLQDGDNGHDDRNGEQLGFLHGVKPLLNTTQHWQTAFEHVQKHACNVTAPKL